MIKRYLRIVCASIIILLRCFLVPFIVVKSFILLRRHRRTYKNQLIYGIQRFASGDSYLDALRANMGENIASSLGRWNSDSASARFVR